jgi:hypothetical protein
MTGHQHANRRKRCGHSKCRRQLCSGAAALRWQGSARQHCAPEPAPPPAACRWKETGDHRYDYALVVTSEPSSRGRQLGHFQLRDPLQLLGELQQEGRAQAAALIDSGPERLVLNMAGYPAGDDQANGTLWYDSCPVLDWRFEDGAYMVHACAARGGSSGSPLWVYDSRDGSRAVVGLHVAGEVVRGRRGDAELHLAVPFTGEAMQWLRSAVAKHSC